MTQHQAPGHSLGAFILGLSAHRLRKAEASFLRDARPCGIILFARNCEGPDQIRRLIGDAKDAIGSDDILVLIDQEGGRVQRLKPPQWRAMPAARAYGLLRREEPSLAERAAFAGARLVAEELADLGINVDCAPVLDLPTGEAHDIIGNRAYGDDPELVISLGRAVADGFLAGGVLPVVKHIPGHGRATADSHVALPSIDTDLATLDATDFRPFQALADLPLAMTAHVLLTAIDAERPVSTSPAIIRDVIRTGIGFDGLLMSDDVSMDALSGKIADRAGAVIAAGCDVGLHCNGSLSEMKKVAAASPRLEGDALRRFQRARAALRTPEPFDRAEALALVARAAATMEARAVMTGAVVGEA